MITTIEERIIIKAVDDVFHVSAIEEEVKVVSSEPTVLTVNNTSVIDISIVAGESIGGHKVVCLRDNKAYLADANNLDCLNKVLGVSINAANEGDNVNVRKFGLISNPNWNLTPNANYFLGIDGALSLNPSGAIYHNLGYALDADNFLVDMKLPIKRIE